jgi:hypothetical protein
MLTNSPTFHKKGDSVEFAQSEIVLFLPEALISET